MERKSSKAAAGKKPKLSLQKKAKQQAADQLLSLPSTDLNETLQFQQPSNRLSSRNKSSSTIVQSKHGAGDVSCVDDINEDSNDNQLTVCPACDKQFQKTSLPQHVQKCLKTKFERNINNKTDGSIGELAEKHKAAKDEKYLCQICNKDLSSLNSQRRAQHVNRCIDKIEDEQRETESQRKALESAKSAVLACPMCGKPCKTDNSRKTHMKKCAQENKIPTEQVLMLAKQQQEEHQINIAAGSLPTFTKPKTTKSATGKRKAKEPTKRIRNRRMMRDSSASELQMDNPPLSCRVKSGNVNFLDHSWVQDFFEAKCLDLDEKWLGPTGINSSKLEEEMQVALALSTSLKEEENRHQHLIGQHIQQDSKLAQSLQNSALGSTENKKQKRKKKGDNTPPLLFVLTEEERKQRLQEKISTLLLPVEDEEDDIDKTPTFTDSKLDTCTMPAASNRNTLCLWNRSITDDKITREFNKKDLYYVASLMPPVEICNVVAGSKIKSMSQIPGRRLSTCNQITRTSSQKTKEGVVNDVIMASTQTAVVLAELADDDDNDSDDEDVINCSGFCPEKTIRIEPSVKTRAAESLALSLLSLVNNTTSSDVLITTASGDIVHAHSCILATRCPKLLEGLLDPSRVDLSDISRDIVMSVLKFVYAGDVTLKKSDVMEVCHLAERLNLTELVDICTPLMKDNSSPTTAKKLDIEDDPADHNIGKRKHSDVEDIVTQILTDEDSLSSEGGEVIGQFADIQSDISEEDYRDIMCSQRQKISQTKMRKSDADQTMEDRIKEEVNDFERQKEEKDFNVEDEIVNFFKDDSFDLTYENKSQNKMSSVENLTNEMIVTKLTLNTKANKNKEEIEERQNKTLADEVKQSVIKSSLKQKKNVLAVSFNGPVTIENKDLTVFNNKSGCNATCESSHDSSKLQKLGQDSRQELVLSSKEPKKKSYGDKLQEKGSDTEEDSRDVVIICSGDSAENNAGIVHGMSESPVKNEMKVDKSKKSLLNVEDTSVVDNSSDEEDAIKYYDQKQKYKQEIDSMPCKVSSKPVCSTPNTAALSPCRNIKTPQTPEIIDLDPEEFSDKYYYSPNVRKRKRKSDTSPVKSPVAICVSPKRKHGNEYKLGIDKIRGTSPAQSPDVSGVDLFCTPSPAEKKNVHHSYVSQDSVANSSTPSPKRLKLSPNKSLRNKLVDDQDHQNSLYYDLQSEQKESKAPSRNTCQQKLLYNSSPRSKLSQRNFLMKLASSPSSSPKPSSSQQLTSGTSKRSIFTESESPETDIVQTGEQHSEKHKLKSDILFKNSHESPATEENFVDCEKDDIQIIGDNMEELSQMSSNSPTFSTRDKTKKKWMFKIKKNTDIHYLGNDVDSSCNEIISRCGNTKKLEHTDNSCDGTSPLESTVADEEMSTGTRAPDGKVKDVSMEEIDHSAVACSPVEDVWAGFEDSGAGFSAGVVRCDSPIGCPSPVFHDENEKNSSQSERNYSKHSVEDSKHSGDLDSDENTKHSDDLDYTLPEGQIDDNSFIAAVIHSGDEDHSVTNRHSSVAKFGDEDEQDKEVDEVVDEDIDDSIMWNEDNTPDDHDKNNDDVLKSENKKRSLDNFKTPVASASRRLDRKVWVPPSPFTPMADYDSMDTPMLKREVQKYGVKAVGKKRMRVLLQDIYRQTHQYETDSDFEDEEDKEVKENEDDDIDDDCEELDFNSSQDSVKSDVLEETVLPVNVEEENISSPQKLKNVKELKEKLLDFILAEPDLHTRILNYEPLELDWLKKQVTEAGIKCSMDKLLDFLDEKCIPFTMKKMRQERAARKGRGRKKGSPKKNSPEKNSPRKQPPKKKSPKKLKKKLDK